MKSIVWIMISLCPFLAIEDSSHSTLINVGYKNRLMFVRTILNGIFINTNGGGDKTWLKWKKNDVRCTMKIHATTLSTAALCIVVYALISILLSYWGRMRLLYCKLLHRKWKPSLRCDLSISFSKIMISNDDASEFYLYDEIQMNEKNNGSKFLI